MSPTDRWPDGFDIRSADPATYRRWVSVGTALVVVAYTAAFLSSWVDSGWDPFWPRILELGAVVLGGTGFLAARLGRTGLGAGLVLVGLWTQIHGDVFLGANVRELAIMVLPGLVIAAGLLIGRRGAVGVAIASSIGVPVAAELGRLFGRGDGLVLPDSLTALIVIWGVTNGSAILVSMAVAAFENALEEGQALADRNERLVRDAPDGIVQLDGSGRVISANPRAIELFSLDEGERLRGPFADRFRDEERIRVSAWLDRGADEILRVRLGGRIAELVGRSVPSGDRDEFVQVMIRDVTEREEAAELAAEYLRILRETPAEVVIFDVAGGDIRLASRGLLVNLSLQASELVGDPVERICPGLDDAGRREILRRIRDADGRTLRAPGLVRREDGTVYPTEVEYAPAQLGSANVLIAFVTDVTEREASRKEQEELQRQLQHSQRMEAVGHLAGGIAHDFNNLLTVIGGSAELLRLDAPPELAGLIDEIDQAQRRGEALVRRLLTFARKEIANPRIVDLGEIVSSTELLIRRLIPATVRVDVEVAPDLPPVLVDPGQVEQVVLNLAANARDAMRDGGRLHISVESTADGSEVRLRVADDGVGMAPEVRERALEPFYTTKASGHGTGLGLATVHGIVTAGGGTIDIDSAPGAGCVVTVSWPARPGAVAEDGAEAGDSPVDHEPRHVLLVEDFADTRTLVERLLRRAGHTVQALDSAEAALELSDATLQGFDIVVTDVVMPGISGIAMVDRMRSRGVSAPALFVSGYLDEAVHGAIRRDERHALLRKPFSGQELADRIAALTADATESSGGPRGFDR